MKLKKLMPFWALLLATAAVSFAAPIRVVLVGDSTVTDNAGWGLGFRQFLTDGIDLINVARGGRSSMSFIKEGSWEKALALKGDYYLIQFGHNDEPGKPGRSTTLDEYRFYMSRYVDDVRAVGAKPVLVTSLVRRQFDKNDPHKINSSLAVRAEIVREIAKAKHVPLIDLHDLSKTYCEKVGRDGCLAFSPKKEGGKYDGTHLNDKGHMIFGRMVAEALTQAVPALAPYILKEPRNAHPVPAEAAYDAVVSFDGSGTYTTLQAAIDAAPSDATAAKPFRILIKSGVYKEQVVVPARKPFLELIGDPGETASTVITTDAADVPAVRVEASDFTAENLTFTSTAAPVGHAQAPAIFLRGARAVFRGCRFLGELTSPRAELGAEAAVFDHCQIHGDADGWVPLSR